MPASLVLDAETDFQRDLEMRYFAVGYMPGRFYYFKPLNMPDRLCAGFNGIPDGVVDTQLRRPDNLNDLVYVV